jgi:TPP-dependent pyruvate/acetoin dehydrogenase alpha subunit
VSVVGGLCTVMNGYALSFQKRGEDRVALTWVGDGSTKSGEVHEAFNFAAVQRLPVVFVIQNNQVALGTRLDQHHRAADFTGWGKAYGMPLLAVDGNNVLDVYAGASLAIERCRSGVGPAMLAAETFRMGGHATHDVKEARETLAPELFDHWGRRDPIGMYEDYLAALDCDLGSADGSTQETRNRALLEEIELSVLAEVDSAAEEALRSRDESMPVPADAGPETCYA